MKMREKEKTSWMPLFLVMAAIFLLCCPVRVQAAKAGFYTENGKTYYLKSNGTRHTGFLTVNGKTYYFDPKTTYMLKGWQYDSSGRIIRGFHSKTGVMFKGFVKNSQGKYRYFRVKDGRMVTGYVYSGDKLRYFNKKTGYMFTGWGKDSSGIRYFSMKNGVMYTKSAKSGNKTWYFNPVRPSKGVGSYGAMYTGLKKIGNYYYYFRPATTISQVKKGGGSMYTGGLLTVSGNTYYFQSNGRAKTGWMSIGGKQYYFNTKGVMYKNTTKTISGYSYQFDANGVATRLKYTTENGYVKVVENGVIHYLYNDYLLIPGVADNTIDDETILAAMADSEAGNQGYYGMLGVCMVILNRTENPAFPSDMRQVLFQKGQFWPTVQNGANFSKRLKGNGWQSEAAARKAARKALQLFKDYQLSGKARKISAYKTADFDYVFFMTPSAFQYSGVNTNLVKWEQYKGHVFFDSWK